MAEKNMPTEAPRIATAMITTWACMISVQVMLPKRIQRIRTGREPRITMVR
jgi:hypothetical protein